MLLNSLKCPFALLSSAHITSALNTVMPTEREREYYNKPEVKAEHYPARRLPFLDHGIGGGDSSIIIKTIICTLALYGLYSLFF